MGEEGPPRPRGSPAAPVPTAVAFPGPVSCAPYCPHAPDRARWISSLSVDKTQGLRGVHVPASLPCSTRGAQTAALLGLGAPADALCLPACGWSGWIQGVVMLATRFLGTGTNKMRSRKLWRTTLPVCFGH